MLPADIPLNCPKCGERLTYIERQDDTQLYLCAQHGVVVPPASGRIFVARGARREALMTRMVTEWLRSRLQRAS